MFSNTLALILKFKMKKVKVLFLLNNNEQSLNIKIYASVVQNQPRKVSSLLGDCFNASKSALYILRASVFLWVP